jgi:DNA modification methylase
MSARILIGDVRDKLREIESDSIDCVVTSPPYWGLRDYHVAGQIGLEPTLGEHISVMVAVFHEMRRVLKPSGTFWLNYGDCYATTPNGRSAADTKAAASDDRTFRDKPFSTIGGGLKPKDLCMIPNRLAIALQEDGWWVRSEIIWGKPNSMPDSSGLYRPSVAHEKIFLLTKSDAGGFFVARDTHEISTRPNLSEKCLAITTGKPIARWIELGSFYNAEAVRMNSQNPRAVKMPDGWDTGSGGHGSHHRNGREKGKRTDKQRGHSRRHAGFNERWDAMSVEEQGANGRYLRNYERAPLPVWEIATRGFHGPHFATFPPELVERCLMAGCPNGGSVLDPFGGSGTTALVADHLGLNATIIELNPEYANDIAAVRLHKHTLKPEVGSLFNYGASP